MTHRDLFLTFVFCLTLCGTALAQQRNVYNPTWESLDQHPTPKWLMDAKLGLFIYGPGFTREEWKQHHAQYGAQRGVRVTQIYSGGMQGPWDSHRQHNKGMRRRCDTIDQPVAALLTDLKQRGLMDETLVIRGGEFGRTPVSENGNGRDHNHRGFTIWMAGGGVRGGISCGETAPFGFAAVQDKVHVHDLHATILYLLGINHEKLTYRYAGRDFRLTDVYGRVVKEIIA